MDERNGGNVAIYARDSHFRSVGEGVTAAIQVSSESEHRYPMKLKSHQDRFIFFTIDQPPPTATFDYCTKQHTLAFNQIGLVRLP
jgi:hypothetical protein